MVNEQVHFRFIVMPCCDHIYSSVSERLPNFCPECGKPVFAAIRGLPSCIRISDEKASLRYKDSA